MLPHGSQEETWGKCNPTGLWAFTVPNSKSPTAKQIKPSPKMKFPRAQPLSRARKSRNRAQNPLPNSVSDALRLDGLGSERSSQARENFREQVNGEKVNSPRLNPRSKRKFTSANFRGVTYHMVYSKLVMII